MTHLVDSPVLKRGGLNINDSPESVLITMPGLQGQGGVAGYYGAVLPHLTNSKMSIRMLEIGSQERKGNIFQPIQDQLSFWSNVQTRPNLVHINPSLEAKSFWRDGLFAWQAKRINSPLLVFFRGWNHEFSNRVERRYLSFFKRSFGRADCFIVLASEFKEKLRQWGVTVPIIVETTTVDERLLNHFDYKRKYELLLQEDRVRLLFLSRVEREKGVFETIDAVKKLIQKGLNIHLSIAGAGRAKKKAEMYVNRIGLEEYVSFLGYVRDTRKVATFCEHDIFCLPSYGEGLPNAVLEAMAFGLPVVATPVGGVKDVFQDRKMGLLTKLSPEDIAEKLETIIKQPVLARQISSFNYQYAREHFMAPKVAERLLRTYREVLESTCQ